MVVNPAFGPQFASLDFSKVAKLPLVLTSATEHYLGTSEMDISVIAGDAAYGTTVDRFKFLEGRAPRSASMDEAAVSFTFAQSRHLHVGSRFAVHFGLTVNTKGFTELPMTLRVVGIEIGCQ